MKNNINEINKRFDKTNEIFETKVNELEQSIERMGVWRINTGKCKINENNAEINDKVRNVVNTSENNGDIYVNSNGVSLNAKPVSYTHLDVYKRQPPNHQITSSP